jgi:hypothetical protein
MYQIEGLIFSVIKYVGKTVNDESKVQFAESISQ